MRQRYRYDSANARTLKETFDVGRNDTRATLYVTGGDYERRGLRVNESAYTAISGETETQYLVSGARVVWQTANAPLVGLDADHRITFAISDVIHSTSAVVDLMSGELLEVTGFYPNGAREHWLDSEASGATAVPLETAGFTGKEADEEVGLTYFGERYLIARIGRWATPDPAEVHGLAGGEVANSYHYISGNLFQARDPLGLGELAGEGLHVSITVWGFSAALSVGAWHQPADKKGGFYISSSVGPGVGASVSAGGQIVGNRGGVESFSGLSTTKTAAAGAGVGAEVSYSQSAKDLDEALAHAKQDVQTIGGLTGSNDKDTKPGTVAVTVGAAVGVGAGYTLDATFAPQVTGKGGLLDGLGEIGRYLFTDDIAPMKPAKSSSAQSNFVNPPGSAVDERYGDGAPLRPEFEHLREADPTARPTAASSTTPAASSSTSAVSSEPPQSGSVQPPSASAPPTSDSTSREADCQCSM